MRLLNVETFAFTVHPDHERPPYAIASHRWQEEEVAFQELRDGQNRYKKGYKKVKAFAEYVRKHVCGIEWMWVDTCCINKDSAAELSEAINLMFKWYRNAEVCIAYLPDVSSVKDRDSFVESEWFKRGWTLQELLAPRTVVFVTNSWQVIGNKGASAHGYRGTSVEQGLESAIARRTGIPEPILHHYDGSHNLTVNERFNWMDGRETTREEDMSYALYGIFRVALPANYGEGGKGARQRLWAAIHQEEDRAAQQVTRFREMVNWLSPPDPWTNHESARQLREPDTGTWLLRSDQYREWLTGSTRSLWLYGKAGCGKTVLCSTAIEDVKEYCEPRRDVGYAIFYCSFSDSRKQRHVDMLSSLVSQLAWKEPAFSMLRRSYDRPNRPLPSFDELENVLIAGLKPYKEVFLLVDALDECPEDGDIRFDMLRWLSRLTQKSDTVKLLTTSRHVLEIQQSMTKSGAQAINIATGTVDRDIRQYVMTQISSHHRLSRLDEDTKVKIEESISLKADGMFRWVYCQVEQLKKLKLMKPKLVREALYALPETLDETYERMLMGIDTTMYGDALNLLRWLAYARSPPTLAALVDASVIDLAGDGSVDLDDRPQLQDTLEILSGLITIVDAPERSFDDPWEHRAYNSEARAPSRVRLAHFSVKEYLESTRILNNDANQFHLESTREHSVLSQSCIVYLMHYSRSTEKQSSRQDFATFPLLQYAAVTWPYHSFRGTKEDVSREVDLLYDDLARRDWCYVYRPDVSQVRLSIYSQDLFRDFSNPASGLYYASFLGLEKVVRILLTKGCEVNARGGKYSNALQAAAYSGHQTIVRILLSAGAGVNAKGGQYGNALQAASWEGCVQVVKTLLDAGANVNAKGGVYGNALQAACCADCAQVVKILLDAGAEVNVQSYTSYGTALQEASRQGRKDVVRLLLDAGADVNAGGNRHRGTALHEASKRGHQGVVQQLIDAGAEANA